ncbi:CAP domain-containing protein [Sphingopyxis sp.]|uniref:CAP domain-containing protein n=1 Tax=Sphingopyxis sp. TaxID=1908224 RepID=UPI003BA9170A
MRRIVPQSNRRVASAVILFAALATTPSVAEPSSFEAGVFDELNYFREDPADYADELRGYRSRFDGKLLIAAEGDEIDVMTREGVAAVDEAIRVLRREAPLTTLIWSDRLQRAAADHVAAQSRSGAVGHYDNRGGPGDRMTARGGGPYVNEAITYGHQTPAGVIHQLLIDDGVPGRGHRFGLLRTDQRYVGVACGAHRIHRTMCVILMSATVDGSPPPPPRSAN